MSDLERLAEANGIALNYVSELGDRRDVSREGIKALLTAMGIDPDAPAAPGHAVSEADAKQIASCYVPPFLEGNRVWGMSCQLYGLKSHRNWGMGDFADLAEFTRLVGDRGGDFVGVNPLHTLFPNDPERCSPYGPSTKRFLNPLYIAPDLEPEYAQIEPVAPDRLRALRETDLIDYSGVAAAKWDALARMHAVFSKEGARRKSFEDYREQCGVDLDNLALFEALSEHMQQQAGAVVPWFEWPDEYSSPTGSGIEEFRRLNGERIEYFAWLQWLADGQLAQAHAVAREAGMRIGLYVDLAVSVAHDSAATWAEPNLVINGAGIGAPPDALNPKGQDWGLAPLSPVALTEQNLVPLRMELEASMAHAGAVRLDHAMSLTRLFWIPKDKDAREGAYVHYPFYDMIGTVADASHRYSALVIAEALGTVPEGFTDALAEADIHAYRVLFFERRKDGEFIPPQAYPVRALACISTHDMPTIRGWWVGRDIEWRQTVGIYDAADAEEEDRARKTAKQQLWDALVTSSLVSSEGSLPEQLDADAVARIHLFAAKTPTRLFGVQIEDALGEVEQANLPGRTDPHPNWRRKISTPLEDLSRNSFFTAVCKAVAEERPRR